MGKKTADLRPEAIDKLAQDRPVVYKILSSKDENIYTGSAKKGRVADRLKDHLPGGSHPIPGGIRVKIEQHSSIDEAQKSESRIISRSKPKHNRQGK
ncbi:MAG TPA: GIY-YIG nuclease family protein [Anaerolineae bacterium]|nr:GIY-YIG nuclease family protein [Anaerolineae bacterium]